MTLEELATITASYVSRDKPYNPTKSAKVVIQTSRAGVPHHPVVDIASAHLGFAWTKGIFILIPQSPIVEVKILSQPIRDLAKKYLEYMKAYHSKLGFNFIPKAREEAWLDGFSAGIRCHVTDVRECK